MGKFTMKETPTGFTFRLRAKNGQIVAVSEVYKTSDGCRRGIKSVKANAERAGIDDRAPGSDKLIRCPKFEVYQDKRLEYRFRLRAKNGKTIAVSEGYVTKAACLAGVESVRRNAADSPVDWEK